MKICIVHNEYGAFSGEEAIIESLSQLLNENDHKVVHFSRSSAEIPQMLFGNVRAFFSGIYSSSAREKMRVQLEVFRPDIVHVHNVFPLISPSVLGECRRAGVPVVMTVHNYRLVCPNGLYMTDGQICERCNGGREYWCVLRNCEKSWFKSLGYALRNYVARKRRMFRDNVTIYACLTKFQRQRLIAEGFPPDRLFVIPNMSYFERRATEANTCDYVGFVGRVSSEKGVQTLIKAARDCGDIQFKAAGAYGRMPHLLADCPVNFEFCGHLNKEQLREFYTKSRIVVLCSIYYEGFPSISIEAMLKGKPLIASRIGGIPEIVDDGVTGLLFEPGNSEDLAEKIRHLWDRPDLCRKIGLAGREKALREYSPERYYERLMAVYEKAIQLGPGGPNYSG